MDHMSSQKSSITSYFFCSLFILLILSIPYTSIILVDAVKHTRNKSQPDSLQGTDISDHIDTGLSADIQQEVTPNNPSSFQIIIL